MAPEQGALPQLRAATDPHAQGGEFYGPLWVNFGPPVRKPVLRRVGLDKAIDVLWEVSERETGMALDPAAVQPGGRPSLVNGRDPADGTAMWWPPRRPRHLHRTGSIVATPSLF